MSEALIAAILLICPGSDTDNKGQVITTECQEQMVNCVINKAGPNDYAKAIRECQDAIRREDTK